MQLGRSFAWLFAIACASGCGLNERGDVAKDVPDASSDGPGLGGGGGGFPTGGTAGGISSAGSSNGGTSGGAGQIGTAGASGATGGTAGIANGGAGGIDTGGTGGEGGTTQTLECDTLFQFVLGVQVCTNPPPDQCALAYGSSQGKAQSCDSVCAVAGLVCKGAQDDVSNQASKLPGNDNPVLCNYVAVSAVCFCGYPSST
jgi:hypothetical protein